jgi:hypothetical protein
VQARRIVPRHALAVSSRDFSHERLRRKSPNPSGGFSSFCRPTPLRINQASKRAVSVPCSGGISGALFGFPRIGREDFPCANASFLFLSYLPQVLSQRPAWSSLLVRSWPSQFPKQQLALCAREAGRSSRPRASALGAAKP